MPVKFHLLFSKLAELIGFLYYKKYIVKIISINDISKINLRFSFEIIFEKLIKNGKNKKIKKSLEINTRASEFKK